MEDWAKAHAEKVVACYEKSNFPYLDSFNDRTIDIAQSLAAIVEVAYRDSSTLESARQELIEAISLTRNEDNGSIVEHRLLQELARLAEKRDPLIGNASELAALCTGLPERPEQYQVSQALHKYGYKAKSARLPGGGQPKYRYVLSYKELADLVERFADGIQPPEIDPKAEAPAVALPSSSTPEISSNGST
ncbi:MAG: DUF3631 domain-containing protein [Acidobacteria bacterium]|nr:DUF3631 domain-containing protein [Acidobacteriota bacterium]